MNTVVKGRLDGSEVPLKPKSPSRTISSTGLDKKKKKEVNVVMSTCMVLNTQQESITKE